MHSNRSLPWIPILMYHRVVPTISEPDPFGNCISLHSFKSHLRWLSRLGYASVSLDAIAALAADPEHRVALPKRAVAITFDDGYRDNHDYAMPALAAHGFTATIFLVSGAIGGDNEFDRANTPERVPMLTAGQIQKMHRAGLTFGSHTHSHPNLEELPCESAAGEITTSREEIEAVVQARVHHFSYPYTRVNSYLENQVREAGYHSACAGVGTPFKQFRLSRISAPQAHGPALVTVMGNRHLKHLARKVVPSAAESLADPRFAAE
jgi:peptidoglycan/xylan/chitin deacetylase (PgdA/CDA1 family)